MSFDLEKLQAVAELGEVIRLQNEALERLQAFRNARPYLIVPNLARMVEENLKENVHVLYKELNNLHRPPEKQVRYICDECSMAFAVPLPGGLCDECKSRLATSATPRTYGAIEAQEKEENSPAEETPAEENAVSEETVADNQPTGEENEPAAEETAEAVADDLSETDQEEEAAENSPEESAEDEVSEEVSPEDAPKDEKND